MTVLVLGGGPAGLAAATALVRAGRAAVVHEAGTYPRHRVCGEFLSPDAAQPLESLGLAGLPARLGAPVLGALRLTASRGGRRLAEAGFVLDAPGHGVSRFDLDEALADHARREGVEVRTGSRVAEVPAGNLPVVVATGRGRRPGAGGSPEGAPPWGGRGWVGVKVHVSGIGIPGLIEIHCIEGAYAGLSATAVRGERVVNVCALVRNDAWDRAGRTPEGLWRLFAGESGPFRERWTRARPIPGTGIAVAGFQFRRRGAVDARGALAVGDAAGLTAPFAGAGQAAALASGIEAARVLVELGPGASAAWEGRFRRRFRRRLAVGAAVQRALLAPRAAAIVLRVVAVAGPAASWLFRTTRGAW